MNAIAGGILLQVAVATRGLELPNGEIYQNLFTHPMWDSCCGQTAGLRSLMEQCCLDTPPIRNYQVRTANHVPHILMRIDYSASTEMARRNALRHDQSCKRRSVRFRQLGPQVELTQLAPAMIYGMLRFNSSGA
jgi:hypothetical protein